MENYLIPAALILFATTISALFQAAHWRKKAQESERHAMQMGLDLSRVGRENHDTGWIQGRKHAIGLMYRIACRATQNGTDVLEALRKVDQIEEASVVQVLEIA